MTEQKAKFRNSVIYLIDPEGHLNFEVHFKNVKKMRCTAKSLDQAIKKCADYLRFRGEFFATHVTAREMKTKPKQTEE